MICNLELVETLLDLCLIISSSAASPASPPPPHSSSTLTNPSRTFALFDPHNTSGLSTCHKKMHPPLTLHRHPMCAEIIEEFTRCHSDHPMGKFFGKCTDLKIKLDRCFRQEKALKRKANFEESKKLRERLQALRKEDAEI